jgi:hypothetical protein
MRVSKIDRCTHTSLSLSSELIFQSYRSCVESSHIVKLWDGIILKRSALYHIPNLISSGNRGKGVGKGHMSNLQRTIAAVMQRTWSGIDNYVLVHIIEQLHRVWSINFWTPPVSPSPACQLVHQAPRQPFKHSKRPCTPQSHRRTACLLLQRLRCDRLAPYPHRYCCHGLPRQDNHCHNHCHCQMTEVPGVSSYTCAPGHAECVGSALTRLAAGTDLRCGTIRHRECHPFLPWIRQDPERLNKARAKK